MRYALLCLMPLSGCLFVSGLTSKECGDGFVDEVEECDDGNTINADGCDAGCSRENRFTLQDINGANVLNARFAVYIESLIQRDGPDQGEVLDTDLAQLDIYITDQPDAASFCAALAADPAAFTNLPDMEGFQLLLIKEDALNAGGFGLSETLSTNANFGAAILFPAPGQAYVGATVTNRVGGVSSLLANNSAFEVNDGDASFSFAPDGTLSGTLSVTLTADRSGLVPFDTVEDFLFDQDGVPDFFAINVPLAIQFRNVPRCD